MVLCSWPKLSLPGLAPAVGEHGLYPNVLIKNQLELGAPVTLVVVVSHSLRTEISRLLLLVGLPVIPCVLPHRVVYADKMLWLPQQSTTSKMTCPHYGIKPVTVTKILPA